MKTKQGDDAIVAPQESSISSVLLRTKLALIFADFRELG